MGLRRIWTRGIKAANKFMLGAAIAYNLKKWLNYNERKAKLLKVEVKFFVRFIRSARTAADSYMSMRINSSASIAENPLLPACAV
jgi:hypothetical protein